MLIGDGTLWGIGSNYHGQLGFPILKEGSSQDQQDGKLLVEELSFLPFNTALQKT